VKTKKIAESSSMRTQDPNFRKSVSGTSTFLCAAPIIQRRIMLKIVAKSVTEAEYIAATSIVQDMMYIKRLL